MGHIFISYSHKDTVYAHKLAENLQRMGFEAWIDERLDYGSQWPQELQKQLDSCSAFIVIMSPRSYESDWVQSELQRARRKSKPIFPLLLEGDEPWLSVESTQYYDVRGEAVPDPEFYSDLKTVMTSTPMARTPGLPEGSARVKLANDPSKPKRGIGIATIGVLLMIFVAGAALLIGPWLKRGTNPTVPAAQSTISSEELTPMPEAALTPEMELVPAGEFTMGSDSSAYNEETPAHTVSLNSFYIDKYEVSNALYKACVDADACNTPNDTSRYSDTTYANHPVVYVDWDMAQTYCEWREARLPTEAEWEKAARGEDGRTYPWGEDIDSTYANYNYNIGDTTAVDSYESGKSRYGIYNMSGNVWEWVADWFSDTYYQDLAVSTLSNPLGPSTGPYKVLRGGSWTDGKDFVRTFTRGWNDLSAFEFRGFGFRCARDANP